MSERTPVTIDPAEGPWERFFGVHPLVLVGTREPDGAHDLAPKHLAMPLSWGPWFGFVCTPRHATWHNALRTGVFTVSYPGPEQILQASLAATPREQGAKPSLAALPVRDATAVDGVLVEGARAWLECEVDRVIEDLGDNGLIVGRVVAAQVALEAIRAADTDDNDLVHEHPLLAYLHPGRFVAVDRSQAFPFHVGFER